MRIPLYGRLASRLRELGLSQSDLAYALGLSPTAISLRMSGKIAWDIREMYRTLEVCRARRLLQEGLSYGEVPRLDNRGRLLYPQPLEVSE